MPSWHYWDSPQVPCTHLDISSGSNGDLADSVWAFQPERGRRGSYLILFLYFLSFMFLTFFLHSEVWAILSSFSLEWTFTSCCQGLSRVWDLPCSQANRLTCHSFKDASRRQDSWVGDLVLYYSWHYTQHKFHISAYFPLSPDFFSGMASIWPAV